MCPYCKSEFKLITHFIDGIEGNAPKGAKFCLEPQMYRIIFIKLSVMERNSNLEVAFQVDQSLFRSRLRTGLVANL